MTTTSLAKVVGRLSKILSGENLITDTAALGPFESDALTMYKCRPSCVALPRDVDELIAVVKACAEHKVPVVTRGASRVVLRPGSVKSSSVHDRR